MSRLRWIPAAALVAASLASRQARADIAVAADVDVGLPISQTTANNYLATGVGFDVRLGYRFRIPYQPLWIIPEVVAGYDDLSAHLVRLRPGVRVSFGRFVVPFVYTHLGWGWTSFDPLGASDPRSLASFDSASGLSFDAGAGVDLAVLRILTVGAHLGYNVVEVGQADAATPPWSAKWLSVGLNGTFFF